MILKWTSSYCLKLFWSHTQLSCEALSQCSLIDRIQSNTACCAASRLRGTVFIKCNILRLDSEHKIYQDRAVHSAEFRLCLLGIIQKQTQVCFKVLKLVGQLNYLTLK